ncbi:hypothetical protein BCEN4_240019 [Burkholderia cenocepacia]|nr:hypothetical protein BCEN4_240019 [Burkholderia cenocepacia]
MRQRVLIRCNAHEIHARQARQARRRHFWTYTLPVILLTKMVHTRVKIISAYAKNMDR